jgi:two-component system, OmpR family, phosphate regulon sensor histidine kinase PhoR
MSDVGGGTSSDRSGAAAAADGEAGAPPGLDLLAAAFRATPSGLAIVSGPELRYRAANELFRSLCPDPGADLTGRRLEDAAPLVNQPLVEVVREALASGECSQGETESVVGESRRWFAYHVQRLEVPGPGAALISLRENTALVQSRWAAEAAADAAARRAAELEAIMEAIPDAVVVFDAAGNVVRMNAAATESWRAAGVDVADPGAAVFSHFELRTEDGCRLSRSDWPVGRALLGERVRGVHLRFAPAGARPIWMMTSAAPILGPVGEVRGAVLEFSDETELHELAEARDDLIRMVSHDLRTPLSAVYAQAHLIRRGGDPPAKVAERAAAIERSCERMSGMIQDLVEVTLLEAGQLPVTPAVVEVGALVPDILHGMRGGLEVDRVRLQLAAPCWASVDPARLERIVVNLVSNALKYSAREVVVALRRDAGAVRLSVADTGVGISIDDQARIFERYYRARGDRRPEGLGLGLYITRLLAEGMGGRVEVESLLGKGSTFHVILPAAEAPSTSRAP